MSMSVVSFAASLFAISNPIGNMVIFISMMQGKDVKKIRSNAIKIMIYTWIGMNITAVVGLQLLKLFGISIAAFSMAGGLLLGHIGFTMTSGATHSSASNKAHAYEDGSDITVVPLTIPLLLGPGGMVAIISFLSINGTNLNTLTEAIVVITGICALIGLCFYSTTYIPNLSPKIKHVANRIMGLIIGSIGLQLVLHSIQTFYHITV